MKSRNWGSLEGVRVAREICVLSWGGPGSHRVVGWSEGPGCEEEGSGYLSGLGWWLEGFCLRGGFTVFLMRFGQWEGYVGKEFKPL